MTCETCQAAREAEKGHLFPQFCPKCLYCGARYVWALRSRPASMDVKERRAWQGRVLTDWEQHGHDRAKMREMAMGTAMPLEPKTK
jgi:hypothetical protein